MPCVPGAILRLDALSLSFLVCPAEVVTVELPNSIVYANISWPTTSPGLLFPVTLLTAQHLHTGDACLMGRGSHQVLANVS